MSPRSPRLSVSLRSLLTMPFAVLTTSIVGVVGYLSYHSGQLAIRDLADQLMNTTVEKVEVHLDGFLQQPHRLLKLNQLAVEQGKLDLNDLEAVYQQFWQQHQVFDAITTLEYTHATGEHIGVGRDQQGLISPAGSLVTVELTGEVPGTQQIWLIDGLSQQQQLLQTLPYWNSKQHPGYQLALQQNNPGWTAVYPFLKIPVAAIGAVLPVYQAGEFSGVFQSTLLLSDLSQFLAQIDFSTNGQIFIIEPSGDLIASSSGEKIYQAVERTKQQQLIRQNLLESSNPIIQKTAEALQIELGRLERFQQSYQFQFTGSKSTHLDNNSLLHHKLTWHRNQYCGKVIPYKDQYGLDLLIVAIVPLSDFTHEIDHNVQQTILFCILALLTTLGIGILTTKCISKPSLGQQDLESLVASKTAALTEVQRIAGVGNWEHDLITGALTWSEEIYRIYEAEDLAPVPRPDLTIQQIHPNDEKRFQRTLLTAQISRQPFELDVKIITQKGHNRYIQYKGKPILDKQNNLRKFVGTVTNITRYKYTEIALQSSRQEFLTLFQNNPTPILIVSLVAGKILNANLSFVKFYGTGIADILHKHCIELNLWNNQTEEEQFWLKLYTQKSIKNFEAVFRTVTGELNTVLITANVMKIDQQETALIVLQDISERKQIEIALEKSLVRYQRLVDDIGETFVVFSHSGLTGIVNYVSGGVESVFGVQKEDIMGHSWQDLIHWLPEDAAEAEAAVIKALAGSEIFQQFEMRFIHPAKGERTVRISQHPSINTINNSVMIEGIVEDITERKQAKIELEKAKVAAEAANQAKSAFIANMNHELRSPLNAILGFTRILQRDPNLSPAQLESANIIHSSGEHLLNIINQILDLAKIEANKVQLEITTINLWDLLKDLNNLFSLRTVEQGLHFDIEHDDQVPQYIQTDLMKLRQVLINLIDNAVKFTQVGYILVKVSLLNCTSEFAILGFQVQDSGCGISLADQNQLFEAFSQAEAGRKSGQGTGLGLNLTREFIKLLGGDIDLDSEVGKGSCFHFTIQAKFSDSIPEVCQFPKQKIIGLLPNQPRYRILVVDDNPINRHLLVEILSILELEVDQAENGQAAIQKWQLYQPHLIFMDVRMPVLNGYDTAYQIRQIEAQDCQTSTESQSKKPTVLVAVSGNVTRDDSCLKAEFDTVLMKPFVEDKIFEILQNYLNLRYRYQTETEAKPLAKISPEKLAPAVKLIDANLINQLKQAAMRGQEETLLQAIQEIATIDSELAQSLTTWATEFDYLSILDTIEQANLTRE